MRIYFSFETPSTLTVVFSAEDGTIICQQTYQNIIQQQNVCYSSYIGQGANMNYLEYTPLPFRQYSLFIGSTSIPISLSPVPFTPVPAPIVPAPPFTPTPAPIAPAPPFVPAPIAPAPPFAHVLQVTILLILVYCYTKYCYNKRRKRHIFHASYTETLNMSNKRELLTF
jgi:hypothetical protein